MAENEHTITTVFKADISNFSASTQELNRYIKTVNSEFNVATASMGKWSDNTDGLQARITQLNKTLEAEKIKLNSLETALADLQKEGKGNTKQAQQLQIAINNQKASIEKTEQSVKGYEDALNELKEAGVETREELDKLNKENDELKEKAKEFGGGLLKGFAVGIAAIGTACVGAVKGLGSLVENTQEYRTGLNQLEAAFSRVGFTAEETYKAYNYFGSVLGDTRKAQETMLVLGQLVKTEQELEQWTDTLTGVYATYGEAIPLESMSEALVLASKQAVAEGGLADALEWGGVNLEQFNEELEALNSTEERSAHIQNTLNGLYGETAKKYNELNKDILDANTAQTDYENTIAKIAEKVQPAMTQFKVIMTDALLKVMETFSQADIENTISNIANLITALVTNVLPPLMNVLSWILDNMNWLGPAILGVVSGITAATVAYKTITGVINLVKIAQLGLNGAMAANPIGLVATAIGVLVTAFTLLWTKCEGFRDFWKNLWENIKSVATKAKDFIVSAFQGLAIILKVPINGVIALINGAIGAINKISVKIPDWVPIFGGKTIGFNISKIPMLEQGGVIDKKTLAIVGENGKEAVVPLERNTQWLDKLADKLANKIGTTQTNTYNVYNTFERMETSRLALHQSNLEMKRLVRG